MRKFCLGDMMLVYDRHLGRENRSGISFVLSMHEPSLYMMPRLSDVIYVMKIQAKFY